MSKLVKIVYLKGHRRGDVSIVDPVKAHGLVRRGLAQEYEEGIELSLAQDPVEDFEETWTWDDQEDQPVKKKRRPRKKKKATMSEEDSDG